MRACVLNQGYLSRDCAEALAELGLEVCTFGPGEDLAVVKQSAADLLLTINFWPALVPIAERMQIPYVAWTVDPLVNVSGVLVDEIRSPWVWLFNFDRFQCSLLERFGVARVHYLPLAANPERHCLRSLTPEQRRRYGGDVSFAGSSLIEATNDYLKFKADAQQVIDSDHPNSHRLTRFLSVAEEIISRYADRPVAPIGDQLIVEVGRQLDFDLSLMTSNMPIELAMVMGKELVGRQRTALIEAFQGLDTVVWGFEDWRRACRGTIRYGGFAEHFTELPLVYNASRINLNLTRANANETAPMRIFDVLSAGGFVLTERKEDILTLFDEGIELVTYDTFTEARERAEYYLAHEGQRLAIAAKGREKVLAKHTMRHRLQTVLTQIETDRAFPASISVPGLASG